jgi:ABC-type hemin transport system ATPase subunit
MRAHENPFRISRAEGLRFRGVVALDQIVARLAALGYRGAIVGPEGSGKTTLLRELEDALAATGLPTNLMRFDDLALLRRVNRETILMIDGAEKLPWPVHAVLALTTARLVVTAHGRREGLPVLLECAASPALMEELLIELAGRDPALVARAKLLFEQKRGNVRQVFSALYDVLAGGS